MRARDGPGVCFCAQPPLAAVEPTTERRGKNEQFPDHPNP